MMKTKSVHIKKVYPEELPKGCQIAFYTTPRQSEDGERLFDRLLEAWTPESVDRLGSTVRDRSGYLYETDDQTIEAVCQKKPEVLMTRGLIDGWKPIPGPLLERLFNDRHRGWTGFHTIFSLPQRASRCTLDHLVIGYEPYIDQRKRLHTCLASMIPWDLFNKALTAAHTFREYLWVDLKSGELRLIRPAPIETITDWLKTRPTPKTLEL